MNLLKKVGMTAVAIAASVGLVAAPALAETGTYAGTNGVISATVSLDTKTLKIIYKVSDPATVDGLMTMIVPNVPKGTSAVSVLLSDTAPENSYFLTGTGSDALLIHLNGTEPIGAPIITGFTGTLSGNTVTYSVPVALVGSPTNVLAFGFAFTDDGSYPAWMTTTALTNATPAPAVKPAAPAAATKTAVKLSKKSQTYKSKKVAKLTVTVSPKTSGKAVIYDGKKKLKTVTVKNGKASYKFSKKLKKGTHKIKVVFKPSDTKKYKTSTSKVVKLKVKK